MKIVRKGSKKSIEMSRNEWLRIGESAGWQMPPASPESKQKARERGVCPGLSILLDRRTEKVNELAVIDKVIYENYGEEHLPRPTLV